MYDLTQAKKEGVGGVPDLGTIDAHVLSTPSEKTSKNPFLDTIDRLWLNQPPVQKTGSVASYHYFVLY